MTSDIYVNVPALRDHLTETREESRIAYELNSKVRSLKYHELLSGDNRCFGVQKDTAYVNDLLSHLLHAMEEYCDNTEELIEANKRKLAESESDARAVLRRSKEE